MYEHNYTLYLSEEKVENYKKLMEKTGYDDLNDFLNAFITIGIYKHIEFNADMFIKANDNLKEPKWKELACKCVTDSDGFLTEYTLYQKAKENYYICIFGDKEIYTPENEEPDYSTNNRSEAFDWFNSYDGFEDENEY